MARRGRKRDLEREVEFWELLSAGIGPVEACRRVGVSRKTGYRWWAEMGGVTTKITRAPSGRYLSLFERRRIAALVREGHGPREIGRRLGRSASTISRELHRNARDWEEEYEAVVAHVRAHEQAKRPKAGKIESSPWLRRFVQKRLNQYWSPEQIARHLRRQYGHRPDRQVCVETIYQSLYRPSEGGLPRSLTRRLRTGRPLRRQRRRPDRRTRRFGETMRSVHQRPLSALDRREPGHWEGDLILGPHSRSAIGTLVERTSRLTLLVHLDGDHTAATVTAALARRLRWLPAPMRQSLTWDQGSEMAEHEAVRLATGMPVYFCDAGSPWQRPSNENTNGLLRQYFPKGTDLSRHSPADLRRVERELNERPRKTLGDRTPAEVFAELSAL